MGTDGRARAVRFHPQTAEEWRAWLAEHHDDAEPGVWVVLWRRASGHPVVPYEALAEEALAVGWIDGLAQPLDDDRSMLWFTRRRKGSQWTRLSKERVARVEASGRMTPAGRAVIDRARADGSWSLLESAEALIVPDDLAAAFDERPGSREAFEAFTPAVRTSILVWITVAKRPATRGARIEETATLAAQGVAAHQRRR